MINVKSKESYSVFVISHPRSGTHLIIDFLRKQFLECASWKFPFEYLDRTFFDIDQLMPCYGKWSINENLAIKLLNRAKHTVVKTHQLPGFDDLNHKADFVKRLWDQSKPIYILRDGRDVLCSMHLWMQEFDPESRCSISDFIRQEENGINRVSRWVNHVYEWTKQDKVLILKYEDVITKPEEVLNRIALHLGLTPQLKQPLLPKRFIKPWDRRIERVFKIHPESTAILGRFNEKKPLKWREDFTEDDKNFFHFHAQDILTKFGYDNMA